MSLPIDPNTHVKDSQYSSFNVSSLEWGKCRRTCKRAHSTAMECQSDVNMNTHRELNSAILSQRQGEHRRRTHEAHDQSSHKGAPPQRKRQKTEPCFQTGAEVGFSHLRLSRVFSTSFIKSLGQYFLLGLGLEEVISWCWIIEIKRWTRGCCEFFPLLRKGAQSWP